MPQGRHRPARHRFAELGIADLVNRFPTLSFKVEFDQSEAFEPWLVTLESGRSASGHTLQQAVARL